MVAETARCCCWFLGNRDHCLPIVLSLMSAEGPHFHAPRRYRVGMGISSFLAQHVRSRA